jgi:hypothetical protein
MTRRERFRKQVLQLTFLSGVVPSATLLLLCFDGMCPGAHTEAVEALIAIALYVLFPVAAVTLGYALILLPFGFDLRILATQIVTACSVACPFVYSVCG